MQKELGKTSKQRVQRIGLLKSLLLGIFVLTSLSSCVHFRAYFNSYYNAQKAFSRAERLKEKRLWKNPHDTVGVSTDEKSLYYRSIEKSSKVLELFGEKPNRFLPRSLFLMGKSYIRLREWKKALQKFDELRKAFPVHSNQEEALYLQAIASYHALPYNIARKEMLLTLDSLQNAAFRMEIMELFARLEKDNNSPQEGLAQYKKLLNDQNLSPLVRGRVLYECTELSAQIFLWADLRQYALSPEIALLTPQQRFRSAYLATYALYQVGQKDKARSEMDSLLRVKTYDTLLSPAYQTLGEWYLSDAYPDSGVKLLLKIPVKFKNSEPAALAYYTVAFYYLNQLKQRPKALLYLDSASYISISPLAQKSREFAASLRKIIDYQTDTLLTDTSWALPRKFLIAELFLLDIGQVDSALAYLEDLKMKYKNNTPLMPKLLYAQAYIYQEVSIDSVRAQNLYSQIIKEYPGTVYSKQAEKNQSLPIQTQTREELAYKAFKIAEDSLFAGYQLASTVLPLFEQVVKLWPGTQAALQSLYIQALLQEQLFFEGEKNSYVLALKTWQNLAKISAENPYKSLAQSKLSALSLNADSEKLPLGPPETFNKDNWSLFYKVEEKIQQEPVYEYDEELDSKESLDPVQNERP